MAWNDPQWGKKDNGGPPDLDELWRRLNKRLAGLFGGKGKGGEPSGAPAGAPLIPGRSLIGFVLAAIAALWLASGFYIVDAGERGVVLRFGKYTETTQPGPHWHLPWPIESVQVVNVDQVRTVEIGYRNNVRNKIPQESLMLTDDENIVDLQFAVQYTVKNPEDYLFNDRSPNDAVKQVAESAMREIVGRSKMDYVLYEGRTDVAAQAKSLMQKILDRYGTGIAISQVTLQNIQPPEQVQAAFDDAVKAGQDKERQKNEAQAYANDVVPRAKGLAARLIEEAQGYRQSVIATAKGDASRFDQIAAEYRRAPEVTRTRLYLDTMQQVLSHTSKVIVEQNGSHNLLYLPLDKLQQMATPRAAPAAPAAPPPAVSDQPATTATPAAPAAGESLFRSRDAFRSRAREDRP